MYKTGLKTGAKERRRLAASAARVRWAARRLPKRKPKVFGPDAFPCFSQLVTDLDFRYVHATDPSTAR